MMNKNKNLLCFVLIVFIILFFSCRDTGNKQKTNAKDSITTSIKTIALNITNANSNFETISHTTLDSLQGVWISGKDKNDIVTIKGNQYIETYKGEKDTLISKIIFSDTCIDDNPTYSYVSKLDDTKKSGEHFISLDIKDTSSCLCYGIDNLNNKHLTLIYNGRFLFFDKK